MGVEIKATSTHDQDPNGDFTASLTHPKEATDKSLLFAVRQEEMYTHFYIEPIGESNFAYRAYKVEFQKDGDLPGVVWKRGEPHSYIDIITPANPVVLHTRDGVVFTAQITIDAPPILSTPLELVPKDLQTAAD